MSEFLKCDAEGCSHLEAVNEITAEMVGKACPICGANLLTEHDWKFYASVMRPSFELMVGLGLAKRAGEDVPVERRMKVGYHDGEISIRVPTPPTSQQG